jgi:dienelactone hydrolase
MLLAGSDDQAPPEPCRRYGAWFHAKGEPLKVVEYPGAYHLFDGIGPVHFVANAVTLASCDLEYNTEARTLRRTDTNAVLTGREIGDYFNTCASRGVHVGGDPEARAAAEHEIGAFLKTALQLP